jgi:hypothetical protein
MIQLKQKQLFDDEVAALKDYLNQFKEHFTGCWE